MKKIIAINASPRKNWNTGTLVRRAAAGAQAAGAEVEVIDLYALERYSGCISCFSCKLKPNEGRCVVKDGLHEVLEKIRQADGVIFGSPNYLGDLSAGFRALFERLVFQHITYRKENINNHDRPIPALLIVTSNVAAQAYEGEGAYAAMLARYQNSLSNYVGKTRTFISGDTLQVNDYERYDWTLFDPEEKKRRREEVFPQEEKAVYDLGSRMVLGEW